MTSPNPIVTTIEPTKAKSWVALLGSVMTFLVPLLAEMQGSMPDPWPAIIGAVLAVATFFGVRQTRNVPKGTVAVPGDQVTALPAGVSYTPVPDNPADGYVNPYKAKK
jgi:hypothetical protein